MILGAESPCLRLQHSGDLGLYPEGYKVSLRVQPLVQQCRVPTAPLPHPGLGLCSFWFPGGLPLFHRPTAAPSQHHCGKRPQASPAHRAAAPLSSCLRPLLGTSHLVCSALSIYYALTVCTVVGVWSRPFPASNPSRRWHVISTCDSEPIRSLDQAEADAGGGGRVERGMASAWG